MMVYVCNLGKFNCIFMYIIKIVGGYINDNINMFVLGKNLIKLKKYMIC